MQAGSKRSRSEASDSAAPGDVASASSAAAALVPSASRGGNEDHAAAASQQSNDDVLLPPEDARRTRARMATSSTTSSASQSSFAAASSSGMAQVLPTSHSGTFVRTDEVVRLMLDTLTSLGYNATANLLMQESGLPPSFDATACRNAVLDGDWRALLALLRAIPFKFSGDAVVMAVAILRQRYLELLEAGDAIAAVHLLQREMQPAMRLLRCAVAGGDTMPAAGGVHGPQPRFSASVSFPPLLSLTQSPHRRDGSGSRVFSRVLGTRVNDNVLLGEAATPPCDAIDDAVLPGTVGHAFEALTQVGSILFGASAGAASSVASQDAAPGPVATSASTAADADLWAVVDSDDEASEEMSMGSSIVAPAAPAAMAGDDGDLVLDCCNGVRVALPQDLLIMHAPSAGRTLAPVEGMRIGRRRVAYVTPFDDQDCGYLRVSSVQALAHEEALNDMSALALPATAAALRAAAGWSGADGGSRLSLLHLLERRLRSDVVPPLRLPVLLGQAVAHQRSQCALHNSSELVPSLLHDHVCGADVLPSACVAVLTGHACEVWGARLSPDGARCASFGRDGSILLWSIDSLRRMHQESTLSSWASLTCWERADAAGRAAPIHVDANASGVVAISSPVSASIPNPIQTDGDDTLRIPLVVRVRTHDLASQLVVTPPASPPFTNVCASTDSCTCVAWHPDGSMLVSAGTSCSAVWLWNAVTGALLAAFDTSHAGGITAVEWVQVHTPGGTEGLPAGAVASQPPCGHFVCAGADGGVWLFAVPNGVQGGVLHRGALAHWRTPPVYSLSCVRATTAAAAAGTTTSASSPPTSPMSATIGGPVNPACVVVALCQDATIYIIHAANGTAPVLEQDVSMCGFKPVSIALDSRARYALIACQGPPPHPAVRPGSRTLGGQPPRAPAVLNPASRLLMPPLGTRSAGLRFRPPASVPPRGAAAPTTSAGRAVATAATPDRSLSTLLREVMLGVGTGMTTQDATVTAAAGMGAYDEAALAEGEHAAQLVLWDMTMAAPVAVYRGHAHHRFLLVPSFGGSGDAVVAIGGEDGVLHLWHRERATELTRLRGHVGVVNSVSWSNADASLLVTASDDGTVRLWGPV